MRNSYFVPSSPPSMLQSSEVCLHFMQRTTFLFVLQIKLIIKAAQGMKTEDKSINEEVFQKLKQLGFQDACIIRALKITDDIEIASQIALKISDQGPDADLSEYLLKSEPTEIKSKTQDIKVGMFSRAKMLFIVNGQLKMGKGKICAQVGHAVIGGYLQIQDEARFDERAKGRLSNWESVGTPKIVVKTDTQKELMDIKKKIEALGIGINTYLVQDAGHTQIKAGSRTVLGIGPAYPEEIDPITQHLKLL